MFNSYVSLPEGRYLKWPLKLWAVRFKNVAPCTSKMVMNDHWWTIDTFPHCWPKDHQPMLIASACKCTCQPPDQVSRSGVWSANPLHHATWVILAIQSETTMSKFDGRKTVSHPQHFIMPVCLGRILRYFHPIHWLTYTIYIYIYAHTFSGDIPKEDCWLYLHVPWQDPFYWCLLSLLLGPSPSFFLQTSLVLRNSSRLLGQKPLMWVSKNKPSPISSFL